jgi:GT2 family glycosyltransferase
VTRSVDLGPAPRPGRGRALPGNRWDLLDGETPPAPPSVTVVVAHYRQQAQLDRTLLALSRQDHPASRLEVVVVDDGSPEAPRVPDGVRLVVQEDRGFRLAAARNLGASVADGEVLCFLDADTVPEPGYVRELTRLPALASDVVTAGRRRHAALGEAPEEARVERIAPALELDEPGWLRRAHADSRDLLDADDRSYRFVIGAVTACSADLFADTGGYDEGFTRYGGEDWEWAYRAWLAGGVLAHVPTAVAWHDGPEWSGRDLADRQRAKNAETLLLADLVPVPGSRGRGLRGRHADVAVHGPTSGGDAARFVCLDSIAAELPEASVTAGGAVGAGAGPDGRALDGRALDGRSLDRVRVDVVVEGAPVRVRDGELRRAVDELDGRGPGSITYVDDTGAPLLTVASRRAAVRRRRWDDDGLSEGVVRHSASIARLDDEPDVEGYVGGWR